MTQHTSHHGMLLITGALLFFALLCPVSALLLDKYVDNGGTYFMGEEVTWIVNLTNDGEEEIVNIIVKDEGSDGMTVVSFKPEEESDFDTNTMEWSIPSLGAGKSAILILNTTFSEAGQWTNRVNVTSIDGNFPDDIIEDTGTVTINTTITAEMTIKPETLNLKSQGTFTVFINVSGVDGEEIDWENSDITCNDSVLRKVIIAGENGERLIAKFYRNTLDVTAGDPVTISCVGYVTVDGEEIKVEGSDEIRVIKEKKDTSSLLDKFFRFLFGLKNDQEIAGEEGEDVPLFTLPDTVKNFGQAKKLDAPVPDGTEEEADDGSEEDPAPGSSNAGGKGNPKNEETTDDSCPGNKCLNNEKEKER